MNSTEQAMVKVCGMRHTENIKALCQLPIDLIGFIFYPKSSRYIGDRKDRLPYSSHIPPHIFKAGVFVNQSLEEVKNEIAYSELDIVQLHGDESPEYCEKIARCAEVIKAFSIDDDFDFEQLESYQSCRYFLFDTKGLQRGGNGTKFDWKLLEKYRGNKAFFLSGGIAPEDSAVLNKLQHPYLAGYDLNSCFETAPALKNISQIETFIQKIS